MHFGNKNNDEIANLISSAVVTVGDTVYSTSWNETLRFNGVVFASICSCKEIGSKPFCPNSQPGDVPADCFNIEIAYATYDIGFEP